MPSKKTNKTRPRSPRHRSPLECIPGPSSKMRSQVRVSQSEQYSHDIVDSEPRVIGFDVRSAVGDEPEVMDVRRASHVVGLSPATLNTLRSRGGGPPYVKMGRRVVYRVKDLRAWRDARLRSSTAG